jgi:hypothetical protein
MQADHQYEEECVGEACPDELIARSHQAPLQRARDHLPDMAKDDQSEDDEEAKQRITRAEQALPLQRLLPLMT